MFRVVLDHFHQSLLFKAIYSSINFEFEGEEMLNDRNLLSMLMLLLPTDIVLQDRLIIFEAIKFFLSQ